MKLDPDMHIGLHLVSFGKSGVTATLLLLFFFCCSAAFTAEIAAAMAEADFFATIDLVLRRDFVTPAAGSTPASASVSSSASADESES
jgi:hypothetical protein